MRLSSLIRHLVLPHWWIMRLFPKSALQAIERAITRSEASHRGEIRFVVESNLPIHALWHRQSARTRAIELFSQLRVWDTEDNSGVLIYVQLIDRHVEIIADRGINAKVSEEFWRTVCRQLETTFRAGRFEAGALEALEIVTTELTRHFPAAANHPNELPDAPVVL